jgi:hypothetical protein
VSPTKVARQGPGVSGVAAKEMSDKERKGSVNIAAGGRARTRDSRAERRRRPQATEATGRHVPERLQSERGDPGRGRWEGPDNSLDQMAFELDLGLEKGNQINTSPSCLTHDT